LIEKIEIPDDQTIAFRLKFATSAFLPALADPFNFIYKKEILDKDQHWHEKNIMGSGPFKFVSYDAGSSIKGERFAEYHHKGAALPSIRSRASSRRRRRPGSPRSAPTRRPLTSADCRLRRATS